VKSARAAGSRTESRSCDARLVRAESSADHCANDSHPMNSPRRRDLLASLSDRVRRGDVAAFEELFHAMHAPLCEVADSFVQSQAIAEEIVQDLFFAIWTKREQLKRVDSLQAYLFTALWWRCRGPRRMWRPSTGAPTSARDTSREASCARHSCADLRINLP
jgi:hypothetical protein